MRKFVKSSNLSRILRRPYWLALLILPTLLLTFQNCGQGFQIKDELAQLAQQNTQQPSGTVDEKTCQNPFDPTEQSPAGTEVITYQISTGSQTECSSSTNRIVSTCDGRTGTWQPALAAHSTCKQPEEVCTYPQSSATATPTGLTANSTVNGYAMSSATYPETCGVKVTRTCQSNGSWSGSVPLYSECAQKCKDTINDKVLNPGEKAIVWNRSTGTTAECQMAKVESSCQANGTMSPSINTGFYKECVVMNPEPEPDPNPSNTALVAATTNGLPVMSGDYKRLYGGGTCIIDSLWNSDIGNGNRIASQRFRAQESGKIVSFRTYWVGGPGYAKGNGGKIRIRIFPDDGSSAHKPNMNATPLGTATHIPNLTNGVVPSGQYFVPVTMNSTQSIVAGQIYHLVYDNTDTDNKNHYIGLNSAASMLEHGRNCRWMDPTDWGFLRGSATSLVEMTKTTNTSGYFIPILQINLDSGKSFGSSLMETGNVDERNGEYVWKVTNSAPIRERFKPTSAKTITGISVQTAASVAGSLRWELKDGNTVLASGQISESKANYKAIDSIQTNRFQGNYKWYDIALNTPVNMTAGKTYDLVFTPQGSSVWVFTVQRNGADYGFSWPSAFTQSQAEHLYNGSWIKAYIWNKASNSSSSNWRTVLHTK